MEIKQIRIQNLSFLADKLGRSVVAAKMGYEDTNYLNQLCRGHGSFGSRTARKIEVALKLDVGWMDIIHSPSSDRADQQLQQAKAPAHAGVEVVRDGEQARADQDGSRFQALLTLGKLIEDFTPAELAELEAQVELIRRRKGGGF
jgi:hypothetical protein